MTNFSSLDAFNTFAESEAGISAISALAESTSDFITATTAITSGIKKNVPIIGNAAICADSIYISGCAGLNFWYSPNLVAKAFFGASCICGVVATATSGTALITSATGIPVAGWVGSFGARSFNKLGKYTLRLGNVTGGKITDPMHIAELMSAN